MECILGIRCNDFVILASDTISARSIFTMKHDHDKMFKVNSHTAMAVVGDAGDAVQFSEYIAKNVQLYKMKNGYDLSPHAASNFTRRFLAECLRSRSAYHVNMLIGGFDKDKGPELYFMDYLASIMDLPFAVHGYSSFFSLSVLDRYYRPDLTREEAVQLVQKCLDEIHTRFIVNLKAFKVRVIDKDGIHDLPDLTSNILPTINVGSAK